MNVVQEPPQLEPPAETSRRAPLVYLRGSWSRVLAEAIVIASSILLAFAVDRWWDARQGEVEEIRVLADVRAELQRNRAQLDSVNAQHRKRSERAAILLREAGPSREGVAPDSLARLADSVFLSP